MVKTASFAPEVTTAMLSEGHQRIARSDPQHMIFSDLVLPSEGLSETLRAPIKGLYLILNVASLE